VEQIGISLRWPPQELWVCPADHVADAGRRRDNCFGEPCGRLTQIPGSGRFAAPDEHSPQRFTDVPTVRLVQGLGQCHSACKS
jgi:hypothetical protein